MKYYEKLKYTHCKSSVTIFQVQNRNSQINDFDDEPNNLFHKFEMEKYVKHFAEGKLEYTKINRDVCKFAKYNLSTKRKSWIMNIYDDNSSDIPIISFELANVFNGKYIRHTISDKKFAKIKDHYRQCTVHYGPEDDNYNDKNTYLDIIKNIIYDNYTLSSSTMELLNNFKPKRTNMWSVDKLISDIKLYGLTEKIAQKIKFFEWFNVRPHRISKYCTKSVDQKCMISPSMSCRNFHDYQKNQLYKIPTTNEIRDQVWFSGKEYTLNERQKKTIIGLFKKENNEFVEQSKNIMFAKFENGKIMHYKMGENDEIIQIDVSDEEQIKTLEKNNNSENDITQQSYLSVMNEQMFKQQDQPYCNDDSDISLSFEDENKHIIVNMIPYPDSKLRIDYVPDDSEYKNIFMEKESLYIFDDINFWDISIIIPGEKTNISNMIRNSLVKLVRNLFGKSFSCVFWRFFNRYYHKNRH